MATYEISRPKLDVLRVVFLEGWNAASDSGAMFRDLLAALDNSDEQITLLIVAGDKRPIYDELSIARDILYHDRLKRIIMVAEGADQAVDHMGATRGEHGLPPIPMIAFEDESAALKIL